MGLHPEYVRSLVRHGPLKADKESGEHRIALSSVVEQMLAVTGSPHLDFTSFMHAWPVISHPPPDNELDETKGAA